MHHHPCHLCRELLFLVASVNCSIEDGGHPSGICQVHIFEKTLNTILWGLDI